MPQLTVGSSGPGVYDYQCSLFALGFDPGKPDGKYGSGTCRATRAMQQTAAKGDRVLIDLAQGDRRIVIPPTFRGPASGIADDATQQEVSIWRQAGYRWLPDGEEYEERRVHVADYDRLPGDSSFLVPVPSAAGTVMRLHVLAAERLEALARAAKDEIGVEVRVASGWRPHRWASLKAYEDELVRLYGKGRTQDQAIAYGKGLLAFDSPHETGLAIDFGCGGLEPVSATISKQQKTAFWIWLKANAWRFGLTPYKREPWHWEVTISLRAWMTGVSDFGVA